MNTEHPEKEHPGMLELQQILRENDIPFEYTNDLNYGGEFILYYPSIEDEGCSVMAQPRGKWIDGHRVMNGDYLLHMEGMIEPGIYAHVPGGGKEEFNLTAAQVFGRIRFDWSLRQIQKRLKRVEHLVDILSPSIIDRGCWD